MQRPSPCRNEAIHFQALFAELHLSVFFNTNIRTGRKYFDGKQLLSMQLSHVVATLNKKHVLKVRTHFLLLSLLFFQSLSISMLKSVLDSLYKCFKYEQTSNEDPEFVFPALCMPVDKTWSSTNEMTGNKTKKTLKV